MAILQRGGLRCGIRSGLPPVERKLYTVDKRGNKEVANAPSTDAKEQPDEQVNPEVLKPQEEAAPDPAVNTTTPPKPATKLRRGTYRPSHKAIFIALAVVILVLGINAGIIALVIRSQNSTKNLPDAQIAISPSVLNQLGVSRAPVADAGAVLIVNPNARFNGQVQIGGNVSIAGQLFLNSKFNANDASLTNLEAGNTSLAQLNVNGDGTLSNLNLRQNLVVAGTTQIQGAVTLSQLLTVNNSVNVGGNLSVGGVLSVGSFHSSSLVSDGSVTIGGHIITEGVAPSISRGPNIGLNGTVSISGNDQAGTIAVNTGTGSPGNGEVASVTFHAGYTNIPHVMVTMISSSPTPFSITRTPAGFSIWTGPLSASVGYAFDYIVEQ